MRPCWAATNASPRKTAADAYIWLAPPILRRMPYLQYLDAFGANAVRHEVVAVNDQFPNIRALACSAEIRIVR